MQKINLWALAGLCIIACSAVAMTGVNDWKERSFVGNTRYSFESVGNEIIIKGETSGKASVLYRQQKIDLSEQPFVSWRWKIKNTYGSINEQSRAGDDYPARVYLLFKTGPLPWQTLTVNYVWSSSGAVGDTWANAYTNNARMMALQAGDEYVGQWRMERRNVAEDFKRLFGIDITELDGYAIMVDGDNTGSMGTAWFSAISFDAGKLQGTQ